MLAVLASVINLFCLTTHELVHSIHLKKNVVTCMTQTHYRVYLGTLEGLVFAFQSDIKPIQKIAARCCNSMFEHAVDGIVTTEDHCWVSLNHYIHFLNLESLAAEGSVQRENGFIGRLCLSSDGHTVWSAHIGGSMLSAWDAHLRTEKFHVNIMSQSTSTRSQT